MQVSCILVVASLLWGVVSSEQTILNAVHTSTSKLETLVRREEIYIKHVEAVIAKNFENLLKLKRHLLTYKDSRSRIEDPTEYVANPINSYSLMKRLTAEWAPVRILLDTIANSINLLRKKTNKLWLLPTEDDVYNATKALARLQETYDLDVKDLTSGLLGGKKQSSRLTAEDCLNVARQAHERLSSYNALIWAKEAERLMVEKERDKTSHHSIERKNEQPTHENLLLSIPDLHSLFQELGIIEEEHTPEEQWKADELEEEEEEDEEEREEWEKEKDKSEEGDEADEFNEFYSAKEEVLYIVAKYADELEFKGEVLRALDEILKLPIPNKDMEQRYATWREEVASEIQGQPYNTDGEINPRSEDIDEHEEEKLYKKLCQGKGQVGIEVTSRLFCRYADRGHPFLRLAPFKEEEVSLSPRIVIIHDAIYDSEIDAAIEEAKNELTVSMVTEDDLNTHRVDDSRVSSTGCVEDLSLAHRLHVRASLIARLSGIAAEILQVTNYGLGGFYGTHYDNNLETPTTVSEEERPATVMFYMSNVEAGGATVFPLAKVAIFPHKGSALLWYNLYRDGKQDLRTVHAGCPVISGSKWVMNKWFTNGGEVFSRPCLLEPDSPVSSLNKTNELNNLGLGPNLTHHLQNALYYDPQMTNHSYS